MQVASDKIEYRNNALTIHFRNYGDDGRNYGELFDFLGDFDIVTASEIGQDIIVMSDNVFQFTHSDECKLRRDSFVVLERECSLKEYIDKNDSNHLNFLQWYYN